MTVANRLLSKHRINRLADKVLKCLSKDQAVIVLRKDGQKYHNKSYQWVEVNSLIELFPKYDIQDMLYMIELLESNRHIDKLNADNKYQIKIKAMPAGEKAYDQGVYVEEVIGFWLRKIQSLFKVSPQMTINNTQNN